MDAGNIASVLLQRRDDIVGDWIARQERPSCSISDDGTETLARELVTAIVRTATADPACPSATEGRRTLARAAAAHGERWRAAGGSPSCVPYENSVLFESFWAAIADAPIADDDRPVVAARIEHALGLCLMASLLGYELGNDPAQRAALEAALEQCCIVAR